MALVPRVDIAADSDETTIAALADLDLYAERTGNVSSADMILADITEATVLFDLAVESLSRAILKSSVTVRMHQCPHVSGLEDPSYGACTDQSYSCVTQEVG